MCDYELLWLNIAGYVGANISEFLKKNNELYTNLRLRRSKRRDLNDESINLNPDQWRTQQYQKIEEGKTMQLNMKLVYIALVSLLLLSSVLLLSVLAQVPQLTQIAFYSYRDGNLEIYVMNSNGTLPRNFYKMSWV